MNRRDLLTSTGAGMALGFCAAVVVAAPGCAPTPAPAATPMRDAIERYKIANEAYAEAAHADDVVRPRLDEPSEAFAAADAALDAALDGLLRCRPADLREEADRIEFLFSFHGPYHGFHPSEEDIALLVASVREA